VAIGEHSLPPEGAFAIYFYTLVHVTTRIQTLTPVATIGRKSGYAGRRGTESRTGQWNDRGEKVRHFVCRNNSDSAYALTV